jgi:RimJ/RimL family protein N-acetyltransferase
MDEPHLDTPRLRLRLMEATDLDDLLKIFGDPKVMASL